MIYFRKTPFDNAIQIPFLPLQLNFEENLDEFEEKD